MLSFAGRIAADYRTLHNLPLFDELCDTADEQLFDNVRLHVPWIFRAILGLFVPS